jgi:hypothetical protein
MLQTIYVVYVGFIWCYHRQKQFTNRYDMKTSTGTRKQGLADISIVVTAIHFRAFDQCCPLLGEIAPSARAKSLKVLAP